MEVFENFLLRKTFLLFSGLIYQLFEGLGTKFEKDEGKLLILVVILMFAKIATNPFIVDLFIFIPKKGDDMRMFQNGKVFQNIEFSLIVMSDLYNFDSSYLILVSPCIHMAVATTTLVFMEVYFVIWSVILWFHWRVYFY